MKLDALVDVPPGVVTEIGPVFAPFGAVAVSAVDEMIVNAAFEPSNVPAVAPVKLVPVMVTDDPALPLVGEKPVIVGGGTTVKFVLLVAVPPGVVTVIGPVVAPGGTVAVICDRFLTLYVAVVPLNVTAVAPVKFALEIVTVVPTPPLMGEKPMMVGAVSAT